MTENELIMKLRQATGAGVMLCKKAIIECGGNIPEAITWLREHANVKPYEQPQQQIRNQGRVQSYIHSNGRLGAMVKLRCYTDFVARTDDFKQLCKNIAMQVAAVKPANFEELLTSKFIKDETLSVVDLIKQVSVKVGEPIIIDDFVRIEV